MERLHKFLQLTSSDRRLLASTVALLGAIRLGLRLLPFRTIRGMITVVVKQAQASAGSRRIGQPSLDRLVWAVTVASQYVPKATCLTQALATQVLLAWHGQPPSNLRVGVAKSEEGRLEGHAWVECQGRIIVGGEDLSRYTLVPGMEQERP